MLSLSLTSSLRLRLRHLPFYNIKMRVLNELAPVLVVLVACAIGVNGTRNANRSRSTTSFCSTSPYGAGRSSACGPVYVFFFFWLGGWMGG